MSTKNNNKACASKCSHVHVVCTVCGQVTSVVLHIQHFFLWGGGGQSRPCVHVARQYISKDLNSEVHGS